MKLRFKNLLSVVLILLLSFTLFSCNKNNDIAEDWTHDSNSCSYDEFIEILKTNQFDKINKCWKSKDDIIVPAVLPKGFKIGDISYQGGMGNITYYLSCDDKDNVEYGIKITNVFNEAKSLKIPAKNYIIVEKSNPINDYSIYLNRSCTWELDYGNVRMAVFINKRDIDFHKDHNSYSPEYQELWIEEEIKKANYDKKLLEDLKTKLEFKRYGDVRGSDLPIYK